MIEGPPYRCQFHMTQCPGGCADRGWCWAEGNPDDPAHEIPKGQTTPKTIPKT